ncbi:GNAT family N-acetyltransferase [Paenibacillus sp. 1011MAR3C5]|uniref:GNAT family N-acetyltransferase n=1 Tax=Paenibacillus sp. 1011MAR3C5 TaxID=1675787 RepID=UPI000E6C1E46|nr:GNAT family N-acetyltransferase [Paenibacillus sp. 1011MAR3C5]RJE89678.1 GNAT family N-acetyltransferase [Paenibacillus sp. 1011MAR3C5]
MIVEQQHFEVRDMRYTIRSANEEDAAALSQLRVKIDGETEHMDREAGEAFISVENFRILIQRDSEQERNLFLVAVADNRLIGFSRCEGIYLKRFAHKAEFGVCILKEYWGYGIGKELLRTSLAWADSAGITKMTLNVLETNKSAIRLYERFGFQIEGVLQNDKVLSDGRYYNTVVMGRFRG